MRSVPIAGATAMRRRSTLSRPVRIRATIVIAWRPMAIVTMAAPDLNLACARSARIAPIAGAVFIETGGRRRLCRHHLQHLWHYRPGRLELGAYLPG